MVMRATGENKAEKRGWWLLCSKDWSGKTSHVRRPLSRDLEETRQCPAAIMQGGAFSENSCLLWSRNSEETSVARVERGRARAAGGGLRVQRGEIRSCRRKTGKHWRAEMTFPHRTVVWIAR